jgi:hypothetical protein
MSNKRGTVVFVITLALSLVAVPVSAGAPPPEAPAAILSYTGCLGNANLVQVAVGDIPANPPCRQGATEVHFSGGDLTSLTAGTGLTGGGANGDVSVALAPSYRLPQMCGTNQGTTWTGSAWVCASLTSQAAFDSLVTLLGTAGTINQSSNPVHWTKLKGVPAGFADGTDDLGPAYSAGFGLDLAGTQFAVNPAQVQRRVADTCASGASIRAIAQDGSVTCQPGPGGVWGLNGTSGTDDSNYLGTSDDRPLNVKVNGQRALRLEPRSESPNVIGGSGDNSVGAGVAGASIGGGGTASDPNSVLGDFGTVGGGYGNVANGPGASVGGGFMNRAEGQRAVIPGGSFNEAIGDWSFAAGFGAHADDFGSFVWSSGGTGTHSTGLNQFVVRASGGLHLLDGQLFCDGCVTRPDIDPKALPGIAGYCAHAQANPLSFPDAPCRTRSEAVDTAGQVGTYSSIAIGTDGNPVISYFDLTNLDLKVARCNDPLCSGRDETLSTVDSTGIVGSDTSIAIGADGNPVISYLNYGNQDLRVARCNDAGCTGGDETLSTVDLTAGHNGSYTSLAIGTDGNPVISYSDGTNDDLKVVHCNDPACTGGGELLSIVDSGGDVGTFSSIAIGADGNPVISYLDATNGDLKVAHCNDPACAGNNETLTAVDSVGNDGYETSLAIGTDGNPVITYVDFISYSDYNLKVARCNDPGCTGGDETLSIVDPGPGTVGDSSSIAIGTDGNPVISYFDFYLARVLLARCNDPACAGGDETISLVDHAYPYGSQTSLAIGTDGNPVISHQDLEEHDLVVSRPALSH